MFFSSAAGQWDRLRDDLFGASFHLQALLGRDVHGATLGVIGLGAIGQALARRASGFGMRVLGWSRTPRSLPGVEACSLEALLAPVTGQDAAVEPASAD